LISAVGLEDLDQLLVVLAQLLDCFALEVGEPPLNRRIRRGRTAELDERAHDRDVDRHGGLSEAHRTALPRPAR
jgi:hypothetical protein